MSFNFRNVLSLSLNITREKVWTTLAFYIFHINQEQWFSLQVSLELKRQHKTTPTWFRNVNQSPHRKFFFFILPFFFSFFSVGLSSVLRAHSFFHLRQNGQWYPTSKYFYTRSYPLHYFLNLILEKKPAFPFSILSAKQWKYWYHFYYVFGMTRSLTGDWTRDLPHSKPVLYH